MGAMVSTALGRRRFASSGILVAAMVLAATLLRRRRIISRRQRTINSPGRWDCMISYTQRNANAKLLAAELFNSMQKRGVTVWLDVKMAQLNSAAMKEAAQNSSCIIAIVTGRERAGDPEDSSYFKRPFCVSELRWAIQRAVPIQPVIQVEDKQRIGELLGEAPDDLSTVLSQVDFVDLNRSRPAYWEASVDEVLRSVKWLVAAAPTLAPGPGPGPGPKPEPEPEAGPRQGEDAHHHGRSSLWKVAHPDHFTVNVRRSPDMADRGPDSDTAGVAGSVHIALEQTDAWIKINDDRWLPKVWLVPATEAELTAHLQRLSVLRELEQSADPSQIVAIMNGVETADDAEVHCRGCDLLNRLAMRGEWDAVAAAGGVEAIVNAMQVQQADLGVQQYGCYALLCLAQGNAARVALITQLGGEASLQRAKDILFPNDEYVTEYAEDALKALAADGQVPHLSRDMNDLKQTRIERLKPLPQTTAAAAAHPLEVGENESHTSKLQHDLNAALMVHIRGLKSNQAVDRITRGLHRTVGRYATGPYRPWTPERSDVNVMRELLSARADPNAADENMNTALSWAALRDDTDAIVLLAESNADLDKPNIGGQTPLMAAVLHGSNAALKCLLVRGADWSKTNNRGKAALALAHDCDEIEAAAELQMAEEKQTSPPLMALLEPLGLLDRVEVLQAALATRRSGTDTTAKVSQMDQLVELCFSGGHGWKEFVAEMDLGPRSALSLAEAIRELPVPDHWLAAQGKPAAAALLSQAGAE